MLNEDIQIENLKNAFWVSIDSKEQKSILDSLIQYNDKGITAIKELLISSDLAEVKSYGLELINNYNKN